MKTIDFALKGNVARIFLGKDDLERWWGDDWNDTPYEHNAGEVYDQFVAGHVDVAFPFEAIVLEPSDGEINSRWCKDDMRDGKVPMFAVLTEPDKIPDAWNYEYSFAVLMGYITTMTRLEAMANVPMEQWEDVAESFDIKEHTPGEGWVCLMGQHVPDDLNGFLPEGAIVLDYVKQDE